MPTAVSFHCFIDKMLDVPLVFKIFECFGELFFIERALVEHLGREDYKRAVILSSADEKSFETYGMLFKDLVFIALANLHQQINKRPRFRRKNSILRIQHRKTARCTAIHF